LIPHEIPQEEGNQKLVDESTSAPIITQATADAAEISSDAAGLLKYTLIANRK